MFQSRLDQNLRLNSAFTDVMVWFKDFCGLPIIHGAIDVISHTNINFTQCYFKQLLIIAKNMWMFL